MTVFDDLINNHEMDDDEKLSLDIKRMKSEVHEDETQPGVPAGQPDPVYKTREQSQVRGGQGPSQPVTGVEVPLSFSDTQAWTAGRYSDGQPAFVKTER